MTDHLAATREQAILGAIVLEGHRTIAARGDSFLGRTAMQKIPYFLKVCGVPLRYRFDVYHYGTFCQSILSDVEELEIQGVVSDQSQNPNKYSAYVPGGQIESFLAQHQSVVRPYLDTIRTVVDALYPWDPARLELISTLHYVSRQLEALGKCPSGQQVIERFEQCKGDKFPRSTVKETLDCMAVAGLVCLSD